MFKVNNGDSKTMCEICSNLTIKTPKWRHPRNFGVLVFNFKKISHTVLVFLIWTSKCWLGRSHGKKTTRSLFSEFGISTNSKQERYLIKLFDIFSFETIHWIYDNILDLQSWAKYLVKSKKMKQNLTRQENFNTC